MYLLMALPVLVLVGLLFLQETAPAVLARRNHTASPAEKQCR